MAVTATIEFDVPRNVARALRSGDFAIGPAQDFVARSSLELMSETIQNAPVGVSGGGGGLRGSFTTDFQDNRLTAIVGSDSQYAPHVEYGTRPHWPPFGEGSPLARWARAKGIPAFLVARKIARRGTSPQKYMERAVEHVRSNVIPEELRRLGDSISRNWGRIR